MRPTYGAPLKYKSMIITVEDHIKELKKKQWAEKESVRAQAELDKKFQQGWRFVLIAPNLRILVPCDKDGKPTEEGQKRIDKLLENTKI